jgi:crossover junction endodeoxyribonuclease RusA
MAAQPGLPDFEWEHSGDELHWFVPGHPRPKGSYRAVNVPGFEYTKIVNTNPKTKAWERIVSAVSATEASQPWGGPVAVRLKFYMPRPNSVKRRYPAAHPDIDKLGRAVLDALTGIVYTDDKQVVRLDLSKHYDDEHPSGVLVWAREI